MSGIAEVLHHLGYIVSGSDISSNYNTDRLHKLGIKIYIGHHANNIINVENINPKLAKYNFGKIRLD